MVRGCHQRFCLRSVMHSHRAIIVYFDRYTAASNHDHDEGLEVDTQRCWNHLRILYCSAGLTNFTGFYLHG